MRRGFAKFFGAAVFCLALITGANSQSSPVSWTLSSASAKAVKAGDRFDARLTGSIGGGWHLYSLTQPAGGPNATRISVASEPTLKLSGVIKSPKPKVEFDENFGINTESYAGSVAFSIPLQAAADAATGKQTLGVNVRFQVCNETTCLPPRTVKVETIIEIAAAAADTFVPVNNSIVAPNPSPKAKTESTPSPTPAVTASPHQQFANTAMVAESKNANAETGESALINETEKPDLANQSEISGGNSAINQSLVSFLWLAISLGALSLLTPCVFPMIPITVTYFTNHSAGNRVKAVQLALVYSLGIILTFTILGMLLAIFVGAAGITLFAANPYVNLLIAGIFLFFALNLFGAYEITVPTNVLTKLDSLTRSREGEGSGIVGALLMGLTFTLTSFTCTSPFVGTILVSASRGNWQMPLVGMLAFSTVFALPFFALALAPQYVASLPRAGGWMNSIKVAMGFLEVAAAIKFISNVDLIWKWGIFTRPAVLAIWIAIGVILAIYLLGKFQLPHDLKPERIGAIRLMSAILCLAISFFLLTGLFGAKLGELEAFLPPDLENSSVKFFEGREEKLKWIENDLDTALAQAKLENKPIFVDFTGYTCTNCRWMEANVFPKREVEAELSNFVLARLYTDGEDAVYEKQQSFQEKSFQTVALPFYAVLDTGGKPVSAFPGLTRNTGEFLNFLKVSVSRQHKPEARSE